MGKHERQKIEQAEKFVVSLLNGTQNRQPHEQNKWFRHSIKLASRLRKDFTEMLSAKHIGNTYDGDEIGDLKLQVNDNTYYIELKMSESPKGKGTLANISQNSLTNSKIFTGSNVLSWSKFRDKNNFSKLILGQLNQYEKYPSKLRKGTIRTQIKQKAKYLKAVFLKYLGRTRCNVSNEACKYVNRKKISPIATIICNIVKLARKDKEDYIKYLKNQNLNTENLKKFLIALLIGYHTVDQIKYILNIPYRKILEILKFYRVYYTNERNGKIYVSTDDLGHQVSKIINKNLTIAFPKGQTNILIKLGSKTLLRIVFHWKNKFQGIQTPCLNIFKEF